MVAYMWMVRLLLIYSVSTGVSGRETPVGSFSVLEKKKSYASNNYGNIKDASGKIIKYNADATKDEIPEGAVDRISYAQLDALDLGWGRNAYWQGEGREALIAWLYTHTWQYGC